MDYKDSSKKLTTEVSSLELGTLQSHWSISPNVSSGRIFFLNHSLKDKIVP